MSGRLAITAQDSSSPPRSALAG